MSKYNPLWEYVQKNGTPSFKLTFEEIQSIAGLPIDHSFLKYKKELADYIGYSMVILHRFQGELLNCTSFDKEHHGAYIQIKLRWHHGAMV